MSPMNSSTLSKDPLADKRFDSQFVNPPYGYEWSKDYDVRFSSLSASNGERAGVRCRSSLPPKGNANFAWVQHFIRAGIGNPSLN